MRRHPPKKSSTKKARPQKKETLSREKTQLHLAMESTFELADEEAEKESRRISAKAYGGGLIPPRGYYAHPFVIDLSGLELADPLTMLVEHAEQLANVIGQIDTVENDGQMVSVGADVIGSSPAVRNLLHLADKGFPLKASMGIWVAEDEVELVEEGERRTVNGEEFTGPFYHFKKWTLYEVSIVIRPADTTTEVVVAGDRTELIQLENTMPQKPKPSTKAGTATDEKLGAESEADIWLRETKIKKLCSDYPEIGHEALKDHWSFEHTEAVIEKLEAKRELSEIKAKYADPPQVGRSPVALTGRSNQGGDQMSEKVTEAAVLMAGGIDGQELLSTHGEEVVNRADLQYRGKMSLQRLILEAAWLNGCQHRFFSDNPGEIMQLAFSTVNLPNILTGVANRALLAGYNSVEGAWEKIAKIGNVNNFQARTSYRMTGAFEFREIQPGGKLESEKLHEEEVYTNQAKTYGRMGEITRKDIKDDNLGALTDIHRRIGRGSKLTINKIFWTEFMANSDFFKTANKNYKAGTTTALAIDSLSTAEQTFLEQTDAEGNVLGAEPKFLLVPPALKVLAENLYASLGQNMTTSTGKGAPGNNPHAGKFEPIHSAYLSNTTIPGHSATAWHLLAHPDDIAVMEIVFLDGKRTPIIEQSESEFSTLGVKFRGYFDFGVAKVDYRGGVKMKGVA